MTSKFFFYKVPETSIILLKEDKYFANDFHVKEQRDNEFIKRVFPGFHYINFNNNNIEWNIEDFSDTGHLNGNGAYKLGEQIKIK